MTDVTNQFDLPPWVRVTQVHGTGFYLEYETGRWFAYARRDWQVPLVFELMAGVMAGLLAAAEAGGTNK
jgi:hypothetical protein